MPDNYEKSIEEIISQANKLKMRPDVLDIQKAVQVMFSAVGLFDEKNALNYYHQSWATLKDPNNEWKILDTPVKVRLFLDNSNAQYNGNSLAWSLLSVELPETLTLEDAVKSNDFKNIIFGIAYRLSFEFKPEEGTTLLPLLPIAPSENTHQALLIPYVSSKVL